MTQVSPLHIIAKSFLCELFLTERFFLFTNVLHVQEGGVPSLDPRSNFTREELRAVFDAVDKDGSGEVRTTNT
jgi:hypothetical protein